jgi:hypothetical protein
MANSHGTKCMTCGKNNVPELLRRLCITTLRRAHNSGYRQHELRNPGKHRPPRSASIVGANSPTFTKTQHSTSPFAKIDRAPQASPKPYNKQNDSRDVTSPRIMAQAFLTKCGWWVCSALVASVLFSSPLLSPLLSFPLNSISFNQQQCDCMCTQKMKNEKVL